MHTYIWMKQRSPSETTASGKVFAPPDACSSTWTPVRIGKISINKTRFFFFSRSICYSFFIQIKKRKNSACTPFEYVWIGSTRTSSACFICAPLSGSCLRLVRGRTNSTRPKSSSPLNTQGATARWCKNLSRGRHAVDTLYKMHSHTYIHVYIWIKQRSPSKTTASGKVFAPPDACSSKWTPVRIGKKKQI